ncbi:MAG: L,D-transpeptidase/peptidoglycan binding protein [Propionibacteriaceae bacterium]|nr:L,D-transpeptidase/peptidoglycan binding protein [Propionibacteriaceae bacterium]
MKATTSQGNKSSESLKARTARLKQTLGSHTTTPKSDAKKTVKVDHTAQTTTASKDTAEKTPPTSGTPAKDSGKKTGQSLKPADYIKAAIEKGQLAQSSSKTSGKVVDKGSVSSGTSSSSKTSPSSTTTSKTSGSKTQSSSPKTTTRTRKVTRRVVKKPTKPPRVVVRDEWGVADLSPESMPFSIWGSQGVRDGDALLAHQSALDKAASQQRAAEKAVAERLAASRAARKASQESAKVDSVKPEPKVVDATVVAPIVVEAASAAEPRTPVVEAAVPAEEAAVPVDETILVPRAEEETFDVQETKAEPLAPPSHVDPTQEVVATKVLPLIPPDPDTLVPVLVHPLEPDKVEPELVLVTQPPQPEPPQEVTDQVLEFVIPAELTAPKVQDEAGQGFTAPDNLSTEIQNVAPPGDTHLQPSEPQLPPTLSFVEAQSQQGQNLTAAPGVGTPIAPRLKKARPKASTPKKTSLKNRIALTETGEVIDPKRGKLMTALAAVIGLVLAVGGVGTSGFFYFESHAKPGTQLAGQSVAGLDRDQIRGIATNIAQNYRPTVAWEGRELLVSPQDLGVTFDVEATVDSVMNAAEAQGVSQKYNPFETKQVPMVMDIDIKTLETFLNESFITEDMRSVPATLKFTKDKFTLVPGIEGTSIDANLAAETLIAAGGVVDEIPVSTAVEPPAILDDEAQKTVDAANLRIKNAPVISGNGKKYTIPAAKISSWMILTPDFDSGTIGLTIDEDKVREELPKLLADNFTQRMVGGEVLVRPDGGTIAVKQYGRDGTQVKDPDAATAGVLEALREGKAATVSIEIVVHKATNKKVQMDDKYLVPNGEKWVEVNRSNYTVTMWEGTTKINSYSVVIGRPGTPTTPGVFKVYAKIPRQTMSGPDYRVENVQWIAYFNGDIALHGNYWVGSFGQAASHGCVGMPNSQAKVLYDWIRVGTMVVVHD